MAYPDTSTHSLFISYQFVCCLSVSQLFSHTYAFRTARWHEFCRYPSLFGFNQYPPDKNSSCIQPSIACRKPLIYLFIP